MKGAPQFPQCGFLRAVEALSQIDRPFAYVNILENQIFVQLYLNCQLAYFSHNYGSSAELIGGSDIMLEMFQNGELKPLVEQYSPAPEA